MMIHKKILNALLLIVLVGGGVMFALPPVTYSQGDTPSVEGLDILFLVDQSGSMGGEAFGASPIDVPAPNDPLNLRFEAIQFALSTLVDYKTNLIPTVQLRMAVINFGDSPQLTLDWTEIHNEAEWGATRDTILETLSVDRFGNTNLGNTDFVEAFEAVDDTFDLLPNDGHQRVIIVLTDGQPCVPDQFTCGQAEAEQAEMDELILFNSRSFPSDQYAIYVMAIDDNGDLWSTRQQDWQAITGIEERATRVATSAEVSQRFSEILRELISTTTSTSNPEATLLRCDPTRDEYIDILPFTKSIHIDLFKNEASPSQMVVRQPDGSIVDNAFPTVTVTNANGAIEEWDISSPVPGKWAFRPCSEEDELRAELEIINTQVMASMPNITFSRFENAIFSFTVVDENNRPLPSYPAPYTLDIQLSALFPDGTVQPLTATDIGNREYESSLLLDQSGIYTIQLRIETVAPDGSSYIIYETDRLGTISTEDIQVTVTALPSGEYKAGETAPIVIQVQDINNTAIDVDALELRVQLLGTDTQAIELVHTDTGLYTGLVTFIEAGYFTIAVEARYSLEATWKTLDSNTINVIASRLIQLVFVTPPTDLELERSTGLPFFFETPNKLEIELKTINADDQTSFDFLRFSQNPDHSLQLIIKDGNGDNVNVTLHSDNNQPGVYQAIIHELKTTGDWTITASISGELNDVYVIDPSHNTVSRKVTVLHNPLQLPFMVGLGLLGIIALGGSGYFVMAQVKRRQYPCVGDLQIVQIEDRNGRLRESIVFDMNLTAKHSNRIVLGRRQLRSLPPSCKVTKIVIACSDSNMSARKQISVSIYSRRKTVTSNKLLSPSSSYRICAMTEGHLEIRKDPRHQRGLF